MKRYIIFCVLLFCSFVDFAQPGLLGNYTFQDKEYSILKRGIFAPVGDPVVSRKQDIDIHNPSPYKTRLLTDGLVITGAVGVTLLGYELIENKSNLTNGELAAKTKDRLPFFDRGNAGYYSPQANKDKLYLV